MRPTTREVLDWKAIEERRNRSRIPLVTECRSCGQVIADGETHCEGCALRHHLEARNRRATHDVRQRGLVP